MVVAGGFALALSLGGCRGLRGPDVQLPVGTCVRESDGGSAVVPCAAPHTHKVIAIVPGDGGACPRVTVMYSTPADAGDDVMTTCFQRDPPAR
jgi:hypothetical protein